MSWKTSLEQAEAEAARYKAASEELRLEVASLREQREQMFSKQILDLEKRVRELSKPTSELRDKSSSDAEVQTINELVYQVRGEEYENDEEQLKTMETHQRILFLHALCHQMQKLLSSQPKLCHYWHM